MEVPMKILLISGSLRKGSFNTMLAEEAARLLAPGASAEILQYADLPLFNADHIYPFGKTAERIRTQIAQADGLWIFCPEYNGSYTGVLKNLLDYASMTFIKDDFASGTPLRNKPVTISATAGKMAAAGAVSQLTVLLKTVQCQVMEEPEVRIALPGSAFTTGEWEPDQEQIEKLAGQAEAFEAFIRRKLCEKS